MKNKRIEHYDNYSGETGDVIKASVFYSDGGMNLFGGSSSRRGLYLSFTFVTIEQNVGYRSERFEMFDKRAGKILIQELPRFNAKKLEEAFDKVKPALPEAYELLAEGLPVSEVLRQVLAMTMRPLMTATQK